MVSEPLVLMHHEWRTNAEYPENLVSIDGLDWLVCKLRKIVFRRVIL